MPSPSEPPWLAFSKLALPVLAGLAGAFVGFFGVWLTNRSNRRNLEYTRRFDMKKDFYFSAVTAASLFQENITKHYGMKNALKEGALVTTDKQTQSGESVESSKLALIATISPGRILLPRKDFQTFETLSVIAMNLMDSQTLDPNLSALSKALEEASKVAKADPGYV